MRIKNQATVYNGIGSLQKKSQNNVSKTIDLRHDTLFNKINDRVKTDYTHLKDAVNFYSGNGEMPFESRFPDKEMHYVLVSANGIDGLELADALSGKGYKISWLIGGMQRFDWYSINTDFVGCNDLLLH